MQFLYKKRFMYAIRQSVMLKLSLYSLAFLFLTGLFITKAQAQDIHYSQFHNPVLTLNPGKTGIFNGDKRLLFSYRDQWASVPVAWKTFSASYDQKFYPRRPSSHFFSGGASFNYDRQGDSGLNLANFNLFGSFSKILNKENIFTVGIGLGFATRGFNTSDLTWDSQWTGSTFDATLPSGELFDAERISFFENSLGVNYRWQKSERKKLDLGIGVYHLIEPGVAFFDDDDINLPRRFNGSAIFSTPLTEKLDLQLNALGQLQNEYSELLGSALVKFYLNQDQRGKEFQLHVGVGYRTSQSWFPIIALEFSERFYVSFNLERDVSAFQADTNGRAGFEAHFRYIITNVKPVKLKLCPIY